MSEDLCVIAVAHGVSLDFYDLSLADLQPELRRSLRLLTCTRFDSAVIELQFSPHTSGLLVCGTGAGSLCLLRLRRTPPPMERLFSHILRQLALGASMTRTPLACVFRFHPIREGLAAVCCGGEARLVEVGVGGVLSAPSPLELSGVDAASKEARTLEWCGELLATGGGDGRVTVWQLIATSTTQGAQMRTSPLLTLAPSAGARLAAVCCLRWVSLADDDAKDPRGALCCGHADGTFRVWDLYRGPSGDGVSANQNTCLPAAPLAGATELNLISGPLQLEEGTNEAQGAVGSGAPPTASPAESLAASRTSSLLSSHFSAPQQRWLLCAAVGSSSVFGAFVRCT